MLWDHKGKRPPLVIPAVLGVQWWMSLIISSPRRDSSSLAFSPGLTQLSHFCPKHSITVHVLLSILIKLDLVGDLQEQVLSYMGLQNLRTEADQSLGPGSDHRANVNLLQATGSTCEDFINQCSVIL